MAYYNECHSYKQETVVNNRFGKIKTRLSMCRKNPLVSVQAVANWGLIHNTTMSSGSDNRSQETWSFKHYYLGSTMHYLQSKLKTLSAADNLVVSSWCAYTAHLISKGKNVFIKNLSV